MRLGIGICYLIREESVLSVKNGLEVDLGLVRQPDIIRVNDEVSFVHSGVAQDPRDPKQEFLANLWPGSD
jgi:hypothetical protein